MHVFHRSPARIMSINLCCVVGVFVRPNGIEIHSHSLLLDTNAVLW